MKRISILRESGQPDRVKVDEVKRAIQAGSTPIGNNRKRKTKMPAIRPTIHI